MKHSTRINKTNPVKVNFLVDLVIFIAFLIALDPRGTGLAIHEWLGIAFGASVVAHLLLHWKWILASTRRFLGRLPRATRLNYLLNTLLFITMTVIVYSGLMISEVALPALGLSLGEGFSWRFLHPQATELFFIPFRHMPARFLEMIGMVRAIACRMHMHAVPAGRKAADLDGDKSALVLRRAEGCASDRFSRIIHKTGLQLRHALRHILRQSRPGKTKKRRARQGNCQKCSHNQSFPVSEFCSQVACLYGRSKM